MSYNTTTKNNFKNNLKITCDSYKLDNSDLLLKLQNLENKTLGDNIKILRLSKGLTQKQFAKILHTGPQSISQYESNKKIPILMVLKRICREFNISMHDLRSDLKDLPEDTWGEKLRKTRLHTGYTNDEFRKLIKISHTTLTKLENNETRLDDKKLIDVCDILNLPYEYLKNNILIPPDLTGNTFGKVIKK